MSLDIISITDFIGILAFACSGILVASERRLDPVGVFVMAFTTAFGGGLLRDIVIDHRPFYWVEHTGYVWLVIALSLLAPRLVRQFRSGLPYQAFIWSDAIGLGFFSVGGTAMSIDAGLPLLPSTILGVCTGALGGMLRDVFMNRLPLILSDRLPYASAAFLGCWLYLGLDWLGLHRSWALVLSALFIVGLRMASWYGGWRIISYGSAYDRRQRRLWRD